MKKILIVLLLASASILALQAVESDTHDNRLYFKVGESDDLTQVPVSLHLENPTISITALEMYLTFPEGVIVTSSRTETRGIGTHAFTDGSTPRGYFVSVSSEGVEHFSGREGPVCTLLCDFSTLSDGDYTITSSGVFAVGVEGDVVTSYTTSSQEEVYTKSDDTLTGVEDISCSKGVLEIYNLQGIKMKSPQKDK